MARKDGIAIDATGTPALEVEADALALPVFADEVRGAAGPVKALDRLLGGALAAAIRAERFEGKAGQELSISTLGRAPAARVHLLGLGDRARPLAPAFEPLRAAVGAGTRAVAVALPSAVEDVPAAARAAAEGAALGGYDFLRYKTEKSRPPGLAAVKVAVPRGRERSAEVRDALRLAGEVAAAVAWAR